MNKHIILHLITFYTSLVILACIGENVDVPRAFNNPLNNKAIDLFILVDEQNTYMNEMQLGLVKTALNSLATELNPAGSSPYFGMYFYGASSSVSAVVPHATTSAAAVKVYLDKKQYTRPELNPSNLIAALNTVRLYCETECRSGVPRVTVVISSLPDSWAETTIRQLESTYGMTVIVIGIGSGGGVTVLNKLASHPSRYYAIPVSTFYELILTAPHIASMVSDVPLQLNINRQLYIPIVASNVYYTVQLNTISFTTTNDTIVMFASNCPSCTVYASLAEPNPTSNNAVANNDRHSFSLGLSSNNALYYFRIPKGTSRLYVSLLGSDVSQVYILGNVFTVPDVMSPLSKSSQPMDLSQTIG